MSRKYPIPEGIKYEIPPRGRAIPYTSPTGVKTFLYNNVVLSRSIGRTSYTLRRWERKKIIPPTPFRINGERVYSEEHLDVIYDAMRECGLLDKRGSGYHYSDTPFSRLVFEGFDRVYKKLFGEKGDIENGKDQE